MIKRILFTVICSLVAVGQTFGQNLFYAAANGPWTNPLTWANAPVISGGVPGTGGDASGTDIPGTGDFVFTEGFIISVGNLAFPAAETCSGLFVAFNTANSINSASFTGASSINVETVMVGYDPATQLPAAPTASVLQQNPNLQITLSGTGIVLNSWSTAAPFYSLTVNPGAGQTAQFFSNMAMGGGTFNIQSGTFNSNFQIHDLSPSSTSEFDVSTGATLNVNSPITGDGTTTSTFKEMTIDGTVNLSAANYINTEIFNVGSSGVLNVVFNGANQTEGWWHTTTAPTTVSLNATSTVNFSANANQALPAITYGNLTLSATGGTHNRTVEGTGNFIVNGLFTVSSSSVVFNSNAGASSNLDFRGDIDNFGGWGTFVNDNLRLNGTSLQTISGGDPINIQNLDVIVNNAAGVTVTNNLDLDQDLTITNGTLTIDGAELSIAGSFTNNGGFSQTSGGTTFDGSGLQEVMGSATTNFLDVTALNSDLEFESAVTIAGILTLGANVSIDADGSDGFGGLTLLSTASNTARVATLPATSSIGGDVTVQRFLTSAPGTIFRYVSSAVSNGTASSWTATTGVNGNPWLYDETVAGASYLGWGQTGGSLSVGRGYAVEATGGITLSQTGPLNQGAVSQSLTYTNGGGDDDVGWNLVGNPYASTIDLDNVSMGGDPNAVLSDNTSGSIQYHYYNTSTGMGTGPISGGLIASGQSFWALATAGGQSVGFNEGSKTINNGTFRRESENTQDVLTISLNQGDVTDVALIGVREGASSEFDESFDTYKRNNAIFNVASFTDDEVRTAINVFNQLENGRVIKLDLYNIDPGAYSFTIDQTFDESLQFVLVDNFLEEEIPIEPSESGMFTYNFEVTSDQLTFGAGRFSIQVGESVITSVEEDFDNLILYPNPVNPGDLLKLKVTNLFDQDINSVDISIISQKGSLLTNETLSTGINGVVEINMDEYSSGVYILRVVGNSTTHHYKVIKN